MELELIKGELHVHSFVSFKTLRIQKNTINALKSKTVLESIQIVSRTYSIFLSDPGPIIVYACPSLTD